MWEGAVIRFALWACLLLTAVLVQSEDVAKRPAEVICEGELCEAAANSEHNSVSDALKAQFADDVQQIEGSPDLEFPSFTGIDSEAISSGTESPMKKVKKSKKGKSTKSAMKKTKKNTQPKESGVELDESTISGPLTPILDLDLNSVPSTKTKKKLRKKKKRTASTNLAHGLGEMDQLAKIDQLSGSVSTALTAEPPAVVGDENSTEDESSDSGKKSKKRRRRRRRRRRKRHPGMPGGMGGHNLPPEVLASLESSQPRGGGG